MVKAALLLLEQEARPDMAPVGLEELAREQPGIIEITIEPFAGVTRVIYDDEHVSLEEISRFMAQYGYPVGPPIAVTEEGSDARQP